MNRLFVDTAGWMATADAKDPLHIRALKARDGWLEQGGILVTSDYILDETLTLIRLRIGIEAAKKWWAMISDSPRCSVEWITPECMEKAVRWFFSWRDQSFSFTDCTRFIVMKELGLEDVLTGDRHFTVARLPDTSLNRRSAVHFLLDLCPVPCTLNLQPSALCL